MNIKETLQIIGLKDKEIEAYLVLLSLGQANAHQIAKQSELERTTIYKVLDNLTEKGLVIKVIKGKKQAYIAESPKILKQLISKQEVALEQVLPVLMAMQGSGKEKPVVKFYEHKDGLRKVLTDSLNCKEKIRRDFAFVENMVDLFGLNFLHRHIDKRVEKKLKVKSLRRYPGKKDASKKDWYLKGENDKLLREVKYLDPEVKFEPFIMIYDHIVVVISSKKESYAIVIESNEFSQAMKTMFDIVWSTAK